MEFIGDDSGLSELQKQIEDAFFSKLVEIGKDVTPRKTENIKIIHLIYVMLLVSVW